MHKPRYTIIPFVPKKGTLIIIVTGKEADMFIFCIWSQHTVESLLVVFRGFDGLPESYSHSHSLHHQRGVFVRGAVEMWSVAFRQQGWPGLLWGALRPGFGLLTPGVNPLVEAKLVLLGWEAPENAVDLCKFLTISVFYLRDIHLIGKELNFSYPSIFIFLAFQCITWKVVRNELSGWATTAWRCLITFLKLLLDTHEMY